MVSFGRMSTNSETGVKQLRINTFTHPRILLKLYYGQVRNRESKLCCAVQKTHARVRVGLPVLTMVGSHASGRGENRRKSGWGYRSLRTRLPTTAIAVVKSSIDHIEYAHTQFVVVYRSFDEPKPYGKVVKSRLVSGVDNRARHRGKVERPFTASAKGARYQADDRQGERVDVQPVAASVGGRHCR